ncbi:PREDICTED: cleavage stimulation factor subunit 2-like [Tarenaya hassleriana]|uniref:cleavage stimulation factor subunit 2-like n=1 Tax=Tarenaya hassleriana TaxID=28532 RepID=UPI00053CA09B|nr:PREDICTED: cleavage stimulation factor subunit 2-like isoform X1 [Tarenaya hassleriana]XP_010555280.1 PREDICTED: cleavage stimulation factor subunit 2-like [Tarenaya hassleriana]
MGKNRKTKRDGEEKSQHCAATVFVTGLPYSFTNPQLEETFSDVGPVRLCFMVTKKGSNEHRGFGFVKFALVDDAKRAIELKNGSTVGGRKITVKHATHRAPLEQRRAKAAEGVSSVDQSETKSDKDSVIPETEKQAHTPEKKLEKQVERKRPAKLCVDLRDKEACSEKQRVARTVIFGGLLDAEMAEMVHRHVQEVGTVCSITYPLPKDELQQNGKNW